MKVSFTLAHRMGLLFVLLLLMVTVGIGVNPDQVAAQGGGATVNVPAAVFFIECPSISSSTQSVRFAYMQLNGEVQVQEATVSNGGLVVVNGTPAVVFEQLSINWWDFDTMYRFIAPNGDYLDVVIYAGNWYRDAQSGVIYQGLSC